MRILIVVAALSIGSWAGRGAHAAPRADAEALEDAREARRQQREDELAARARAKLEASARRAFVAARGECARPGKLLAAMVEQVFDPSGFGHAVIRDWRGLTDDKRARFVELADLVVGGEERTHGIAAICVKHAQLVSVDQRGDTGVFIKLYRPELDDCTSLMFQRDSDRWRYDGVWFCGVSIFNETWRRRLGGGSYGPAEYGMAMEYLMHAADRLAP